MVAERMPEQVRTVSITVEVDTNKATYRQTFDNIEDARAWLEETLNGIM